MTLVLTLCLFAFVVGVFVGTIGALFLASRG